MVKTKRLQLADEAQKVALSEVTYVPWGEWVQPTAFRKNVKNVLKFGAPIFWGHPEVAPGRSLSVALAAGIPCLYAECGGGGRVRPADLLAYGQEGNDNIRMAGGLNLPATLYGDDGDDRPDSRQGSTENAGRTNDQEQCERGTS